MAPTGTSCKYAWPKPLKPSYYNWHISSSQLLQHPHTLNVCSLKDEAKPFLNSETNPSHFLVQKPRIISAMRTSKIIYIQGVS
jgi:hypothetical protein